MNWLLRSRLLVVAPDCVSKAPLSLTLTMEPPFTLDRASFACSSKKLEGLPTKRENSLSVGLYLHQQFHLTSFSSSSSLILPLAKANQLDPSQSLFCFFLRKQNHSAVKVALQDRLSYGILLQIEYPDLSDTQY